MPNGVASGLTLTVCIAVACLALPPATVTFPGSPATGGSPVKLAGISTSIASYEGRVPSNVQLTRVPPSTEQLTGPEKFSTPANPSAPVATTPSGSSSVIVTGFAVPSTGASPRLVIVTTSRPLPPESTFALEPGKTDVRDGTALPASSPTLSTRKRLLDGGTSVTITLPGP